MKKELVVGAGMTQPDVPFSVAIRVQARETLYIAGQVPTDADGNVVGRGDIEAQTRHVFGLIEAVLAAAGATFKNVVALNIYVTDIRFRETITKVRREILEAPYPATTLVEVSALASEDWLVEIDGVAGLD